MTTPHHRRLRCGAIRYEINADPIIGVECHCTDCQRESGNGHAPTGYSRAPPHIKGTVSEWAMIADSGNKNPGAFAPAAALCVYDLCRQPRCL